MLFPRKPGPDSSPLAIASVVLVSVLLLVLISLVTDHFRSAKSPLLISASAMDQPIVQPMNALLEQYFAPNNSIERTEWEHALPTDAERQQMRKLIKHLLQLDDFSGPVSEPEFLARFAPLLAKSVLLRFHEDIFCTIHEHFPNTSAGTGRFPRFWGYTVLTARVHSNRPHLHHSAPHFQSDGDVCNQAAALFERTRSRSLVIAGANRFAVRGKAASPCQPRNAMADAAHNNQTMFHTVCAALLEASGGTDTFIQWHGMAASSCNGDGAFISVGARGTHPLYDKKNATVNRLVKSVNTLADQRRAAMTPATDPDCRLVASTNIFGRMVNGVPAKKACGTPAAPKNVTGHFIHVEQKSRMIAQWDMWTRALEKVFPAATEGAII